jgi:hypothetical protein
MISIILILGTIYISILILNILQKSSWVISILSTITIGSLLGFTLLALVNLTATKIWKNHLDDVVLNTHTNIENIQVFSEKDIVYLEYYHDSDTLSNKIDITKCEIIKSDLNRIEKRQLKFKCNTFFFSTEENNYCVYYKNKIELR